MTRAELEQRRFEAQKLFAKGVRQANVARTLGVTRTTAQRWKLRYEAGRMGATKTKGRPPRVDREKLRALFESQQSWTYVGFALKVQALFGVTYDKDHCGRILKTFRGAKYKPRQAAAASTERAL
jgi:transposase